MRRTRVVEALMCLLLLLSLLAGCKKEEVGGFLSESPTACSTGTEKAMPCPGLSKPTDLYKAWRRGSFRFLGTRIITISFSGSIVI